MIQPTNLATAIGLTTFLLLIISAQAGCMGDWDCPGTSKCRDQGQGGGGWLCVSASPPAITTDKKCVYNADCDSGYYCERYYC